MQAGDVEARRAVIGREPPTAQDAAIGLHRQRLHSGRHEPGTGIEGGIQHQVLPLSDEPRKTNQAQQ